jgi:hypothetical protein
VKKHKGVLFMAVKSTFWKSSSKVFENWIKIWIFKCNWNIQNFPFPISSYDVIRQLKVS